jgi:hypothetical protein
MAKSKLVNSNKLTFGKRKGGKPKKFNGPKSKPTKPYRQQGR